MILDQINDKKHVLLKPKLTTRPRTSSPTPIAASSRTGRAEFELVKVNRLASRSLGFSRVPFQRDFVSPAARTCSRSDSIDKPSISWTSSRAITSSCSTKGRHSSRRPEAA